MTRQISAMTCLVMLCVTAVALAQGASPQSGFVIVPDTTVENPSDLGLRAHSNHLIFVPARGIVITSPQGETPGSLACVYQLVTLTTGCPISSATTVPAGGSNIIAVVDAYDYPTASDDFDTFSTEFGLPTGNNCNSGKACFTKVYATGVQPRVNAGWALEAALDIEWAHAMAPHAQIFLVEAASNRLLDLLDAVDAASDIVATCNHTTTGCKGVVSMSWGAGEFSLETTSDFDGHFTTAGVVYTAASGETGGTPGWPSSSPNVVSCGGTTINRGNTGSFTTETAWENSGGGDSLYESVPSYQSSITSVSNLVGDFRGTPDLSFDSDPNSGVSIYTSTPYHGVSGWLILGGTSVSAQGLAGIINLAGSFAANSSAELATIYSTYNSVNYSTDFRDITSGSTASCSKHHPLSPCFEAGTGWDFLTGVGSVLGTSGK